MAEAISKQEQELQKLEAEIQHKRHIVDQQKKALELLMPLHDSLFPHAALANSENGQRPKPPHIGCRTATLRAVHAIPSDTFSVRDIYSILETQQLDFNLETNRSNVSAYLRDFVSDDIIEIAEEGSGRRATIYRKK